MEHTQSFFPEHLSKQVRELYLSAAIMNFAAASAALFEPIYLYTLGWSLSGIILFFLAVYAVYFLIMPLGAKIARAKGYEHSIFYSSFFLIGYFLSLFALKGNSIFIYTAILCLAIQKMLYWPGYHADLALYGREDERGREISNLIVINSIVSVLAPLIGGAIVALGGFSSLFIFVSALILVSNFPLLSTREVFKPKDFSYIGAYKRLFSKDYRRQFFTFLGFGEEIIYLLIWPVFIFAILKGAFLLGAIAAIATLISSFIVLFVGRASDLRHRIPILRTGTVFYSLASFLRLLVAGAWGVFLVDTMIRASKNILAVPLIAITYDKAVSTSVMKTVLHFEMSIVVGKIFTMLLLLAILNLFKGNFAPVFVLGGVFAWFYALAKEGK